MPRRRLTRRVLADGTPRRALVTTLLLLVIVFVSCLVVASPFALRMLDLQSHDWERLSRVGQTYGAASALLSVLALASRTRTSPCRSLVPFKLANRVLADPEANPAPQADI